MVIYCCKNGCMRHIQFGDTFCDIHNTRDNKEDLYKQNQERERENPRPIRSWNQGFDFFD